MVKVLVGSHEGVVEQTEDEFGTLRTLSRTQPEYFLQCHGFSVRDRNNDRGGPPSLGYGYLEYAPYGDLSDLLDEVSKQPK